MNLDKKPVKIALSDKHLCTSVAHGLSCRAALLYWLLLRIFKLLLGQSFIDRWR